jgi:hypothetical protein
MSGDNRMSPKDAAAFCGMSLRSFQRWTKQTGLRPDGYAGARARYKPESLDRWMRFLRDDAERFRQAS